MQKVLRELFQEIRNGRMGRALFAGYFVATIALVSALALLLVGVAGSVAVFLGAAGGGQHQWPMYVFTLPLMAGFAFVWANLHAKRARDIGLPGWTTVLALVVVGSAAGYLLPDSVARLIGLAITAALILVPSNAFRRTERMVGG